jgi:hypothetical protein
MSNKLSFIKENIVTHMLRVCLLSNLKKFKRELFILLIIILILYIFNIIYFII